MFTFNNYNLSSIEWNPVDFDVIGGQFELVGYPLTLSNGMKFNVFSFLKEINDFSFNNKSGIFLTKTLNNNDIILDKSTQNIENNLKSIQTCIADFFGNVYKHYSIHGLLSGLVVSQEEFKPEDQLIFNFVDDYVYIEDFYGKILTNGGFGDSQLNFGPRNEPFTEYQKWNYFLHNDVIILFAYNSNYSNVLVKNDKNHLNLIQLNNSVQVQLSKTDINNTVSNSIDTLNAVINDYTNVPKTTPGGVISDSTFQTTYDIILANKSKLQLQLVEYAKYHYPSAMNDSPTLSAKCFRDMGYIIDAVAADILNNANHRSIDIANMYFQVSLVGTAFPGSSIPTLPASEVPATIDCIKKLKTYITGVDIPVSPTPFTTTGLITNASRINDVSNRVDDIVYTLENGGLLKSYSPVGNPSQSDIVFSNIILQNRARIQNEIKNYVTSKGYLSNPTLLDKCNRDVGLVVDAIAHELKTGVKSKSIEYGLTYWDGTTTRIPNSSVFNHKFKTTDSFTQIKQSISFILNEQPTIEGIQNKSLPNTSYLFLKSYKEGTVNRNSVVDSFTVKYDPNPILNESSLISKRDNTPYLQNYLGIFPYEYLNDNGKCDFYFHPLKNYQTSEYHYLNGKMNREYFKIYSGTNQKNGLNKIYLSYASDTISVNFKPNKLTEFYFSATSNPIYLKDSGLVESGSFGGSFPYSSDRIYTSQRNAFQEIPELNNIIKSTDTKENKFLCSWLYDDGKSKTWYDRFYNPAYYSLDQALSAAHLVYNKSLDGTDNLVYDKPSEVFLTPGVLYKYYHIGNEDSLNNLKYLNYKFVNDTELVYSNTLNITSWNSSILYDSSDYKNNGLTYGNSGNFYGDYWKMDGSNYAIFQANDILLEENKFTTSMWLKFDDWSNVNGYQIFGNYYNSGFGLINEAKNVAPILTVINIDSGVLYNLNYKFTEASNAKVGKYVWDIVQRLSDMSYWLFDSASSVGIKYNVNNSIVSENQNGVKGVIDFKSFLPKISQVETDSKENLYLFDDISKKYAVISKDGLLIQGGSASQECRRIEVDLLDNLIDGNTGPKIYGNCSVIDNNNHLWQVVGPNLYKDGNVIATVGASNQITCDMYNNIWIISDDDAYTKFDSNGKFVFRYFFNKTPLVGETNCPPAPAPTPVKLQFLDEDLPFLATNDKRYILTYDDFKQILVSPPEEKPKPIIEPITHRRRVVDFISIPTLIKDDSNLTSICGLSAVQTDQLVMVDLNDNEAYIINQFGQLILKINLENLVENDSINPAFRSGGDFTGYQNIRKYKKTNKTTFSWKFQTATKSGSVITNSTSHNLSADVSRLAKGWHNFTFSFDSSRGVAKYYIDSVLVNQKYFSGGDILYYNYRTSLILGATTIKNTLLNNFLNVDDGFRMVGYVGDLKIYNYNLNDGDIKQLYYSSPFSPKIKNLIWNMKVGSRNYVEEITEWFQFQLPTNKSKYFNINVHNLNVDENIKKNIELAIYNTMNKLSPAHTILNKINWK